MEKKITVLHFELDGHLGGIESFLLNLYSQIDRSKVEFHFVAACKTPAIEEELLELGGIVHHVASHKNVIAYIRDIKALLQSDFDIVHCHKNSAANILPIFIARRNSNSEIIIHSHNTSPSVEGIGKILHILNKNKLIRYTNIRFACSIEAGKWMYGKADYKIIKNGIITNKFIYNMSVRNMKRRELGLDSTTFVIGHVGRFEQQKNHIKLIEFFYAFVQCHLDSKLLLIGNGSLLETIKRKTKELHIENSVLFLGERSDVAEIMMCMDAFLMTSIYEGLPVAAVEAQASGLPVFLPNTISKDTKITDAVYWFDLNDSAEEISALVWKYAQSNSEFSRLKRNQQVVEKGYDIKSTADVIFNYYKLLRQYH